METRTGVQRNSERLVPLLHIGCSSSMWTTFHDTGLDATFGRIGTQGRTNLDDETLESRSSVYAKERSPNECNNPSYGLETHLSNRELKKLVLRSPQRGLQTVYGSLHARYLPRRRRSSSPRLHCSAPQSSVLRSFASNANFG